MRIPESEMELVKIDPFAYNTLSDSYPANLPVKAKASAAVGNVSAIAGFSQLFDKLFSLPSLTDLVKYAPMYCAEYTQCAKVGLYFLIEETLTLVNATAPSGIPHTWSMNDSQEFLALNNRSIQIIGNFQDGTLHIVGPLIGNGNLIGAIMLFPGDADVSWGADNLAPSQLYISALKDVCRLLSMLIDNFQLSAGNREYSQKLELILQITSTLNSQIIDFEASAIIVERQIQRITNADRCVIALNSRTRSESVKWLPTEIIKYVTKTQQPLLLDSVAGSSFEAALPIGIHSFYAFPLENDNHSIGVLALAFQKTQNRDNLKWDLVRIIANIASAALQRIKLFAETENARNHARMLLERIQNETRVKDAILQNSLNGYVSVDLDGVITFVNDYATRVLGVDSAVLIGKSAEEALPLEDPGPHLIRLSLNKRNEVLRREVRFKKSDGTELFLESEAFTLRQNDGSDIGALWIFLNITQIHALQSELENMNRIAMMGSEAEQIAHDMGNVIMGALGGVNSIEIMADSFQLNDQVRSDVAIIHSAISRLTEMAANIRYLANPKMPQFESCAAEPFVYAILQTLKPRISVQDIQVETYIEPGVTLFIDEGMVARAIENLCVNAIESMSKGGTLILTVRSTTQPLAGAVGADGSAIDDSGQTALLMPDSRQYAAEIVIADNGKGIPKEHMNQIWEVRKTFGKKHGSGLGLAIVSQVVEAHKGEKQVQSEPGKGTIFTLRLPALRSELG